jgi:hypothetical protein
VEEQIYNSTPILNLSTRWRQAVNFTSLLFYPWGKSPQYLQLGGWVCPRATLDAVEKRKSLAEFEVITVLVTKKYLLEYNAVSPLKFTQRFL